MLHVALRAKTYSYLKDNNDEDKKAQGTKKCVKKRKLRFQDYKNCLEAALTERKITYLDVYVYVYMMYIILKKIKKNL